MPPRAYVISESNYQQLRENPPNVVVLPWGATEAHNYHLPHGTDVYEASHLALRGTELAYGSGAKVGVLPAIPFGNNEQQLDQVATISFTTRTAMAILDDVVRSLKSQGIDRLVLVNGHGGNEFKPMIRDIQNKYGVLIVRVNFFQLAPEVSAEVFDEPGDHADEMETSLLLHLEPELVVMEQAGPGSRNAVEVEGLDQAGVWTPRPWSATHPDTGCGDPKLATAEKGAKYFEAMAASLSKLLIGLSKAEKGQLPYL